MMRESDLEIEDIARRLAQNVVETPCENPEEIKIKLLGFYYEKYNEYDICYKVNDSGCSINLADVSTNMNRIFPECRETHRLAIVELDRVLKVHYKMEELLKEILPHQTGKIAKKISDLLSIKGEWGC